MADITAINGVGSTGNATFNRALRTDVAEPQAPATDRAEFSEMAQLLSTHQIEGQPPVRAQKVADIREAIANGTYETDDKIDYVVGRLMNTLGVRAAPVSN